MWSGWGRKAKNLDQTNRAHQGLRDTDFHPVNKAPWTGGGAKYEVPVKVSKATT